MHPALQAQYPWVEPDDPDFFEASLAYEIADLGRDMIVMAQRLSDISEQLLLLSPAELEQPPL